jgi:hypothetical protein
MLATIKSLFYNNPVEDEPDLYKDCIIKFYLIKDILIHPDICHYTRIYFLVLNTIILEPPCSSMFVKNHKYITSNGIVYETYKEHLPIIGDNVKETILFGGVDNNARLIGYWINNQYIWIDLYKSIIQPFNINTYELRMNGGISFRVFLKNK